MFNQIKNHLERNYYGRSSNGKKYYFDSEGKIVGNSIENSTSSSEVITIYFDDDGMALNSHYGKIVFTVTNSGDILISPVLGDSNDVQLTKNGLSTYRNDFLNEMLERDPKDFAQSNLGSVGKAILDETKTNVTLTLGDIVIKGIKAQASSDNIFSTLPYSLKIENLTVEENPTPKNKNDNQCSLRVR